MKKKSTIKKSKNIITKHSNEAGESLHNGLGDAIGFGGFGFPGSGFPGQRGTAPVENIDTIFQNLRWYLASNFRQVLSQAYVEIGLIQTVVDVPCYDAFRDGVDIRSKQLDEDQIEELKISLERENDLNVVCQAQKWNRLYGGAGIIILTDQDPEEPLNIKAIQKDSYLKFRAADLWELTWTTQNSQDYDPALQMFDFEFYNYYGESVHKSQVMQLKGLEAPSFIRSRLRGWGLSVMEVLVRSINQYLKSTDLSFEVLDEFKLDIYKIKNLTNMLLSPVGTQKVQQRIQMANWQKNFQHALVMDGEDDYLQKQLSFSGLSEAMQGIRMQVAADMRMPITKLFGTSASAGIGNTDQNDMENYNSMVESQVRDKAKFDVLRICELKCQKLFGFIPDDLTIAFKPLRVLTAEQEESVKTQKFGRLQAAADAGRITDYEYREACNKGHLFDISLDNAGDQLNPDDPEVAQLIQEGSRSLKSKGEAEPESEKSEKPKDKE